MNKYIICTGVYKMCCLSSRVAHDSEDFEGNQLSHNVITIDAGELVWAVAFGSRTADTKPYSTNLNWYRYRIATDLLLATGLSSGRIRVWQVKTGECWMHCPTIHIGANGLPVSLMDFLKLDGHPDVGGILCGFAHF